MNAERRIQRVRAALPPAGQSKPDWQIVCEIARAMGGDGFNFVTPEEIWGEVRALCAGGRGMTYTRLDTRGPQWPCPAVDHAGTPRLHIDAFAAAPQRDPATGTPDYKLTVARVERTTSPSDGGDP